MPAPAPAHRANEEARLDALLRRHAEPLPALDDESFGAAFERFADARVVLIGEASHGTSEFYRARAAITRRLVERHGFGLVAIEGDWPDAARIDRHVRALGDDRVDSGDTPFSRFPSWMWRNHEVLAFVRWLQRHNAERPAAARCAFRGLDIYSLRASMDAVLRYLDARYPERAGEARRRYACLTPWQDDRGAYGARVEWGGGDSCENAVVEQLDDLLRARLETLDHGEGLFDATQNARVVRAAEQYYRSLYHGSVSSWNLRDNHMFDTLRQLLRQRGRDARAVVWAHNSHVGDASATAMGWRGEFNLGQLARIAWGDEAVLLGMGSDHGEVAAADDWGGPLRIKQVPPAREDSWERRFLQAGLPASLTDWRGERRRTLREALAQARLQRAIGVIYRPQSERLSHYYEAVLAEQFDAYLWFERGTPVTPLDPLDGGAGAESETYPFGV